MPSGSSALLKEGKCLLKMALPMSLGYICHFLQQVVLLLVLGHTGAESLAAAALGNLFANACGNALIFGIATSIDTLSSQAVGAKNYKRVGGITSRALAILGSLCVPVSILWYNASIVLTNLGQDEPTAILACAFVRYLIFGLPASAAFEVFKRHLLCINITTPPLVCNIVGIFTTLGFSAWFVYGTQLSFLGAPLAISITQWVQLFLILVYVRNHKACDGLWGRLTGRKLPESQLPEEKDGSKGGAADEEQWGNAGNATFAADKEQWGNAGNRASALSSLDSISTVDVGYHNEVLSSSSIKPVSGSLGTAEVSSQSTREGVYIGLENKKEAAAMMPSADDIGSLATPVAAMDVSSMPTALDLPHALASIKTTTALDPPPPPAPTLTSEEMLVASFAGLSIVEAGRGWVEFITLGAPSAAMLIVEWGSFEAGAVISGLVSVTALAAHTVIATTAAICFMPILGVSIAAGIRVGTFMGEKNPEAAKHSFNAVMVLGACYALICATVVGSLHSVWGRVFTDDAGVLDLLSKNLPLLCGYVIFDGMQCVSSGVLRGVGRPSIAAMANVLAYVVVGLPLCYVFAINLSMGLAGVWVGFIFAVASAFLGLFLPLKYALDWKKLSDVAWERAQQGLAAPGGH